MDRSVSFDTSDSARGVSRWSLAVAGLGLAAVVGVAAARVGAKEAEAVGALAAGAVGPTAPAGSAFWAHWGDGRAELAGYRLTQPRYGELREGTAVHVYVTEPFSYTARVKADPGRHPDSDVFQVLKLNAVKDFRTGIYDYNLMTSVFVPVSPHPKVRVGHPTKITFSGQEWCGMLFEQLKLGPEGVERDRFSYFDGEGEGSERLPWPKGGLTVEALPIFVRGLPSGPPLERGEKLEAPILPSVERARLLHRDLAWTQGSVERSAETTELEVPAGRFEVDTYTVRLASGAVFRYRVEAAAPRRLIAWEGPDGEAAELTGVARLPYWQLNAEGQEAQLEKLGLPVPPRR